MIINEKNKSLEKLVGIKSSRKTYYVQLKETLSEITKRNTQLEIINQLAKSITVNMSFDDMMAEVMQKLQQVIHFDRIALFRLVNDQLMMTHVFPTHLTKLQMGDLLPEEHSLYWKVAQNKKHIISNLETDKNIFFEKEILSPLGIRTVIVFPLIIKNKVTGVISIGSMKQTVYSDQDISFLYQVADHLAVSIDNSKLYLEMVEMNKELEGTFQAVSDVLLQINPDCTISRYNQAVLKYFSVSEEEMQSKKCYELLYNLETACDSCVMNELHEDGNKISKIIKYNHQTLDSYFYPKFGPNKEWLGIIMYAKDISKRMQMEAQLIQSAKLAAIGELAASVAHELNNPLTAILGNAQLLLRELDPDSSQENLMKDIHHCGVRCKNIVKNLLSFSKQDDYDYEELHLDMLVEHALKLVSYQINKIDVSIKNHYSKSLPSILGSSQHIEQIIINLLLNAKDALNTKPDGKIKIHIGTTYEAPYILQKNNKQSLFSYVAIEDNGHGIDDQNLQKIFTPFFSTKQALKGTGLGLSVSLGIAAVHGGTITVDSEVGIGTTFTLFLPIYSI